MSVIRFTFSQQAATPSAAPAGRTREQTRVELRDAIQHTLQDAKAATDEATRNWQIDGKPITITGGNGGIPRPPTPPGGYVFGTGFEDNSKIIPKQAVDISIAFFMMVAVIIVGWPLARAFGRRIERRADTPALAPAFTDQLQRIEQAVDAMSIEIERISESQRFMAKLQNSAQPERLALPADRVS